MTDEASPDPEVTADEGQPIDQVADNPTSMARRIAVGVGIALGVGAIYFGVTGFMAYRAATELSSALRQAQDSARSLDIAAAASSLNQAQAASHNFNTATAGPLWWLAAHAPAVGGRIDTAKHLSTDVDAVLTAAEQILNKATSLSDGSLRAADGAIDLAALAGLAPAMREVASATRSTNEDLKTIDLGNLPDSMSKSVMEIGVQLPELSHRMNDLAEGLGFMPAMFGADGPRTWAVLFQNPGEIRATGGMVGGFSRLSFDHGKVSVVEVGTDDKLATTSGPVDYSVLPDEVVSQWGK